MKHLKIFLLLIFCFAFAFYQSAFAQYNGQQFDCQYFDAPQGNDATSSPFGGIYKPNRTDLSGGEPAPDYAYFPALVVFVQFKDEADDPRGSWQSNSSPIYLDSMIAQYKNPNGEWWEKYNPYTKMLTSHFCEISRGKLHIISPAGAFSVVLSKTPLEYWYASNYNNYTAEKMIHREIWDSVRAQGLTDWRPYDRWKKVGNLFYFCDLGSGDGYVDMIYKVHKSPGWFMWNGSPMSILWGKAGYNQLGYYNNYNNVIDTVDYTNIIKINYGASQIGSGVTISHTGSKFDYISTIGHEQGHQMFMQGHVTYSRCSYGFGGDRFYSPYDMVLNEYMTPRNAQFGTTNTLGDYSSRVTGDGELLKVPIQGNEFYILASRNRVSPWDNLMLGDTIIPFNSNLSYGKGLYIYHIENGIYFPSGDISPQDMECADGYWEWEYAGRGQVNLWYDCFTSGQYDWMFFKKKNVLYSNDPSILFNPNPYGDEISFHYRYLDTTRICWWGFGKKPVDACHVGTDRILTNDNYEYTKDGIWGDRWDAWKVGYNEVFSPYSSPSTKEWNNSQSEIFIYYESYNSSTNEASIKIYRVGEPIGKPMSENDILSITPPSRPMGLSISFTECIDDVVHPILTWKHNMEPDMIDQINHPGVKRYRIGRAISDIDSVPWNYGGCADQYFSDTSDPTFIDYATSINCIGNDNILRIRYIVKAVDKSQWESVPSDFVATSADNVAFPDNFKSSNNVSKDFKMYQNYPNPFNPVTNIKYELPKDIFVTIKIYDILGREIKTLVNEHKNAGRYLISFNGSELASGIYFYRIVAGNFISVKRMVLIK